MVPKIRRKTDLTRVVEPPEGGKVLPLTLCETPLELFETPGAFEAGLRARFPVGAPARAGPGAQPLARGRPIGRGPTRGVRGLPDFNRA